VDLPIDESTASLSTVTFAVVDLETTGGSPWRCGITEVGAVKLKGGECIGTFHTLVNPGMAVPPEVTYFTGVTTAMVLPAPTIDAVLPALLEFLGGAVIVGHNVRFDLSFLGVVSDRLGYPRPANRVVDTCTLARRLVGDEVRDCKLATLAEFFGTTRRPIHRAFEDATATGEVLHGLFERAGSLGVVALDDLLELPTVRAPVALAKLKLTRALPRQPGVYVVRDRRGEALFIGAADNLRRQVRSHFGEGGKDRHQFGALIREVWSIDHTVCRSALEASVHAVRMKEQLRPRYDPESRQWPQYRYLKLTLHDARPRLAVVTRTQPADGCLYVGPLASAAVARQVAAAIESIVPLHGCAHRAGGAPAESSCPSTHLCPRRLTPEACRGLLDGLVDGLTRKPDRLIEPLAGKMAVLAAARRFEDASELRDGAAALAYTLDRQRRFDSLRRAGRVMLAVAGEGGAILDQGRLIAAWPAGARPPAPPEPAEESGAFPPAPDPAGSHRRPPAPPPHRRPPAHGQPPPGPPPHQPPPPLPPPHQPLPPALADELALVVRWMDERWDRLQILDAGAGLDWPAPYLSPFGPETRVWGHGGGSGVGRRRRDAVA
jgi:DNA polymerase-3 subunit epsilon